MVMAIFIRVIMKSIDRGFYFLWGAIVLVGIIIAFASNHYPSFTGSEAMLVWMIAIGCGFIAYSFYEIINKGMGRSILYFGLAFSLPAVIILTMVQEELSVMDAFVIIMILMGLAQLIRFVIFRRYQHDRPQRDR